MKLGEGLGGKEERGSQLNYIGGELGIALLWTGSAFLFPSLPQCASGLLPRISSRVVRGQVWLGVASPCGWVRLVNVDCYPGLYGCWRLVPEGLRRTYDVSVGH